MSLKHLHKLLVLLMLDIVLNRPLLSVLYELDICIILEDFSLVSLETDPLKNSARNNIFLKALSEVVGLVIYALALIC